uniref:Ig-like domain-containing protein n=1 Tax=Sphaeramia orbicularis TaxID=375764 RepID=A0A673AMM2_9TELE
MVRWEILFTMIIIKFVYGRPPPLPPLSMKDGCFLVFPEVEIFRVEGDAVILSFPTFERVLEVRNLAPPTANYQITKSNRTENATFEAEGRVVQKERQLWLLPAQASDSGDYTCTYRNASYCVTGSITLHVFGSSSVDMDKLSYPRSAALGQKITFACPSLDSFNNTHRQTEWYKVTLELSRDGSFQRDMGFLIIPVVKRSHAGLYICRLNVSINNQQYKVSRAIQLRVNGPNLEPEVTVEPDLPVTSDPVLISSIYTTVQTPIVPPPVIVSPLNGTIYESSHGSGVELFCKVLTGCETADSTTVTWLVDGQSVESSYLDGRALQGGRRVSRMSTDCQIEIRLIILEMTEEDTQTELKCITQNQGGTQEAVVHLQLEDSTSTWLVVAAVGMSCFLGVVSVFLCVLFKPKRKKKLDYILARQNSTF